MMPYHSARLQASTNPCSNTTFVSRERGAYLSTSRFTEPNEPPHIMDN